MVIEKNKVYRIKGNSEYFKDKYGTYNPEFAMEGLDMDVFKHSWMDMAAKGNIAAIVFSFRMSEAGRLTEAMYNPCYYGKVGRLGEIVCETELEEIS